MSLSDDWTSQDSMVLQILANTLAGQNREARAAVLLEFVLVRDPENTDAMRALCGVYLMLDRHEDALGMVERYERVAPPEKRQPDMQMAKGRALWALGHSNEAIEVMNSYLAGEGTS